MTESLRRIAATNEVLGAFVMWMEESALAAAAAADADFAAGLDRGPLQGIPLAVKDIIATKDAPTTANSRMLGPEWDRGMDAPVVARLRDAGRHLVGKSTTSEFAAGLPDPTKGFPIPRNPWNIEHTRRDPAPGRASRWLPDWSSAGSAPTPVARCGRRRPPMARRVSR